MKNAISAVAVLLFSSSAAFALEPREQFSNMSFNERVIVQSNLTQTGHYSSGIDGIWGSGTEAAIRGFMMDCCSKKLASQSDWSSALAQIVYLETGEEEGISYATDPAEMQEETVGEDLPSWVPRWLRVSTLGADATIEDWLNASADVQLASAGEYQLSPVPPDQVRTQIVSGFLLDRAHEVQACISEMIQFGVGTGQLTLGETLYPRLANSCVISMAFRG